MARRRRCGLPLARCLVAVLLLTLLAACVAPLATPTVPSVPFDAGESGQSFATPTANLLTAVADRAPSDEAPPLAIPATDTPEPTEPPAEEPADTPQPTPDEPLILNGDPAWHQAIETPDGAHIGVVTATELNIRDAPDVDGAVVDTTWRNHLVVIDAAAWNNSEGQTWYRVGDGRYVAAAWVEPFIPTAPPQIYDGEWVDVNLTDFYAVAYEGATPVYAAIITAGRNGQTPLGVFQILYRVRVETMDAATLGVSPDDPDYYVQPDVEYTQYFKAGGFAIHGNYWVPPQEFGTFTSHGCVGLLNPDAAWFWNFLSPGSTVSIHV